MTETPKPASAVQDMLDAAMDAQAAKMRLAKRAFDAVDAPEALNGLSRGAKGGGKLSRSETVTVRLDPKLRYLAELAARLHRRTLSSYIEWAIESSLGNNQLAGDHNGPSIKDESEYLWDVDDADRFAKLALRYPSLLTHEEQVRWKLIRECGHLWRGRFGPPPSHEWKWQVVEASLCFDRLRDSWELFCAVANGDRPASDLPTWPKSNRPAPKSSTGFDDIDDDIPF